MNRTAVADPAPLRVLRDRSASLPAPLTAFIGRERALEELSAIARGARLLTLTGPGGSGKTRLAIEIARSLETSFDDGVAWIELAAIGDAALVPQTVASALGIRAEAGRGAASGRLPLLRRLSR